MPNIIAGAIGLLLFNLGVNLAIVNAVTLVIIPAAIKIGIGLAASAAVSALTQRRTPAVRPSDGQQEIRQEVPLRRKTLGTARVSGPIWWSETDSADPDTLYLGFLINHGRIEGYIDFWIDDNQVEIASDGEVTSAPYIAADDEIVYILTRLGAAIETAYSELNTVFAVPDARGDGIATVLCSFNNFEDAETQLDVYPGGIPRFRTTFTGSVAFDPRDPDQDKDDETTWFATENPVVHLLTYCFLDPDGYGIPYDWVEGNLQEWMAAMDTCDEVVDLASGDTERRYRLSLTYTLDRDPKDVVADIMASCDGRMWVRRDGTVGISVGVVRDPAVTIRESDILSLNMQYGRERFDQAAGIRAQYMSPDHGYVEQEMDPWPDGATVQDLFERRVVQLDLTMVPSHSQARRLSKREYVKNSNAWNGTVVCNLAGIRARDERHIRLSIPDLEIDDEIFEVVDYAEDMGELQVTIEVNQVSSEIDEWDLNNEEGTPPDVAPGFTEEQVPQADGTAIGSMTSGGGLAAAFDKGASEPASACAVGSSSSSYVGKTFSAAKALTRCRAYSSNDQGFIQFGSSSIVTVSFYAKQGTAPASGTDGTLLSSVTLNDIEASFWSVDLDSPDIITEWDHAWVRVIQGGGGGQSYVGELIFWEAI